MLLGAPTVMGAEHAYFHVWPTKRFISHYVGHTSGRNNLQAWLKNFWLGMEPQSLKKLPMTQNTGTHLFSNTRHWTDHPYALLSALLRHRKGFQFKQYLKSSMGSALASWEVTTPSATRIPHNYYISLKNKGVNNRLMSAGGRRFPGARPRPWKRQQKSAMLSQRKILHLDAANPTPHSNSSHNKSPIYKLTKLSYRLGKMEDFFLFLFLNSWQMGGTI